MAEPHHWMYTNDSGDAGGRVDFWPNGDRVKLCDQQSDGARVRLRVENVSKGGKREYDLEASGKDDCSSSDPSEQPGNLAEGDCFRFEIRLFNNGTEVDGSYDGAQWRNYNDSNTEC